MINMKHMPHLVHLIHIIQMIHKILHSISLKNKACDTPTTDPISKVARRRRQTSWVEYGLRINFITYTRVFIHRRSTKLSVFELPCRLGIVSANYCKRLPILSTARKHLPNLTIQHVNKKRVQQHVCNGKVFFSFSNIHSEKLENHEMQLVEKVCVPMHRNNVS